MSRFLARGACDAYELVLTPPYSLSGPVNTIMYEFLRRLTLIHPTFSLDDNPRALNFLPTDVDDVLLLPHKYELIPFPDPNPSTRAGRYGDPSVPMELGQWVKGGKLADHWAGCVRLSAVLSSCGPLTDPGDV